MFRTIEDIQHEMKQREQVTQKTIGELEKQIKALQNQVRFLLNKVGKLPLRAPGGTVMTDWLANKRIVLQELASDECTTLNEWLDVHDTKSLVPGHTVVFQKQLNHCLLVTTYAYGWKQLDYKFGRFAHDHRETHRQWKRDMCPQDWVVLEKIHLPIKGGSND